MTPTEMATWALAELAQALGPRATTLTDGDVRRLLYVPIEVGATHDMLAAAMRGFVSRLPPDDPLHVVVLPTIDVPGVITYCATSATLAVRVTEQYDLASHGVQRTIDVGLA